MIVGLVVDGSGSPLCTEMWPGNTADVTTLLPVIDRLRQRIRHRPRLRRGATAA
jgi:transposase